MGKVYDDFETIGVVRAIATGTRAVASYANIANAVVTVPLSQQDPTQADSLEYLRVDYNANLSKATGGSGSVGISIDGAAPDADTVRSVSFAQAPAGTPLGVGGTFFLPRTSATAKVVTLQATSSDTNTLTIANITLAVSRVRMPGGLG